MQNGNRNSLLWQGLAFDSMATYDLSCEFRESSNFELKLTKWAVVQEILKEFNGENEKETWNCVISISAGTENLAAMEKYCQGPKIDDKSFSKIDNKWRS